MSKFHSTVSRRDFMKTLGLAGAGLGAAGAAIPVVNDLDGLISTPKDLKRPWWIKEVDDITTEVDWNLMAPFDSAKYDNFAKHLTPEDAQAITQKRNEDKKGWLTGGNVPGRTHKDLAIKRGGWAAVIRAAATQMLIPEPSFWSRLWTGPRTAETPERLGIPKWQGTPEENSKMVWSALRLFGASSIGFVPINDDTKHMIFTRCKYAPTKPIVYEDADEPAETDNKRIFPNKVKWAIVYTTRQSLRLFKRGTSWSSDGAAGCAYDNCGINQYRLQEFLRVLGYNGIGQDLFGTSNIVGFGCFAGLGEMGRLQHLITPEWGPMIRESTVVFTDLPLEPSKPIDFGASRFCHTCRKCAEACPPNALSVEEEPSWEITPKYTDTIQPQLFNNPGKKTWYFDHLKCNTYWKQTDSYCGVCNGICVFSKEDRASVHNLVKPVVASTGIFDGFFYNMDEAFGYGVAGPEKLGEFWEMNLPVNGIDYGEDPYIDKEWR